MIAGTHRDRNASACASPAPVTHGASWPSLHRSGAMKENAGVAAARARSPGSGRNDRMCAAQKAWFPVGRAAVADRIVVLQQGPRPRQRGGQVRVGRRGAEALRVPLVLQLDHPHVPDRTQAARPRGAGPGRRGGHAGHAGPGTLAAGHARARGEDQQEYRGGERPPPALHHQHACLQLRDSEPRWWRARPRPGSFPARRGPASRRCGAARCPGRASRSRRSG